MWRLRHVRVTPNRLNSLYNTSVNRPFHVSNCLAKEENVSKPSSNQNIGQDKKTEDSSDKKDKKTTQTKGFPWGKLTLVGLLSGGVGLAAYYVGNPEQFHAYFDKYKDAVESKVRYFTEPSRNKLLPDPMPQYAGGLPPRTLVLDLDETLVHSTWSRATGWKTAKRPGVDAFLAYMSSFYEIVVYTSAMPGYGEPILEKLDPNGYISHRLYRDATKYEKGVHLKDLSKLNRDLARTIIIDDDANCFRLQPDNGIRIAPFTGDVNDRYLLDLIPFLEYIVREDIPDVRPVIGSYRGLDIPLEFAKRQQLRSQEKGRDSKTSASALRAVTGGGGGMASSEHAIQEKGAEPPPGSIWNRLRQHKGTTN
ncbi:Mitochondrial import inner membrane translocase subunit TIM50 [Galdieria sulphuraria]|uniref:Mitochondrial import inner membrane translocase subunit TIM50 n=1 Tax=Galdieria sulphuraria TaxID=130081 RepID=M2W7T1_GALSU|nr:mitochondrial presequence translocase subunit Tim50 [Galdieria sulphuraria]EME31871.1 mitochondrial presequence translocase subunit Tim50 [Galdieria sulphuraria]GJD10373.1 Mitochondrial import inner membrane translocase subunit TIM50 [Galdieria sulphuraria]|eukprot:XP_005708391.1 mitochondrial presequence translocase subunit Tim50 [Galdieria sulphuraria]